MKREFIYGQCNNPISQLCYGKSRKPVSKVGCGVVALYNALVFKGIDAEFSDLLRAMEKLGMPWLFGVFGTKPFSLKRYFKKNNIPYKNYISVKHFKNSLTDGKIGIVCAWNKGFRGLHFYCICSENGEYRSMNFISSDQALSFDLLQITPLRFVTGYIL